MTSYLVYNEDGYAGTYYDYTFALQVAQEQIPARIEIVTDTYQPIELVIISDLGIHKYRYDGKFTMPVGD